MNVTAARSSVEMGATLALSLLSQAGFYLLCLSTLTR